MKPGEKDSNLVSLDLDDLIEKSGGFWKDILLEVISEMNPWDVDLVELSERYSKKVERMKELNFKIPANVLIVSSVLLRMKSDLLTFSGPDLEYELEEWVSTGEFLNEFSSLPMDENLQEKSEQEDLTNFNVDPEMPIQVKPKRVSKRRITALELISAIQEVLEDKERYKLKKEKNREEIVVSEGIDINHLIEATYLRVMEILMRKNKALFSELVNGSKEDTIAIFISLLHLSHNKRVKLIQPELYGEMFIQPFSSSDGGKGEVG